MAEVLKCIHCQEANQDFNTKTLWKHYQDEHKSYKTPCSLCVNKFPRDSDLIEHMEKVHLKMKPQKVFLCVHCNGKTFTLQSGLSDHYDDVHRKYHVPCSCGNRFLNNVLLREHTDNDCMV